MDTLIQTLLEPLAYAFMQRALLAGVIVGILCAVVGAYVVVRGMAFIGGELSHAVLPGVAVAYITGGNIFLGALTAAIASALSIGILLRYSKLREDTAIGIILAGSFALGVLLMSTVEGYSGDIAGFLFGNILGVMPGDLLLTAGVGLGVLVLVALFYKELLLVSFDPVLAETLGLPVALFDYALLVLLAVTIVVAMQTVGVILVLALLVTPPATAFLLTNRFRTMMIAAAFFGGAAALIGLYLSYYFQVSSGAAVVLTSVAIFLLVWLLAPEQGVLARLLAQRLPAVAHRTPGTDAVRREATR